MTFFLLTLFSSPKYIFPGHCVLPPGVRKFSGKPALGLRSRTSRSGSPSRPLVVTAAFTRSAVPLSLQALLPPRTPESKERLPPTQLQRRRSAVTMVNISDLIGTTSH